MSILFVCRLLRYSVVPVRKVSGPVARKAPRMEQSTKIPGVYHSISSVMSVLDEYSGLSQVQELLNIYNESKEREIDADVRGERKPLIVIEGMDGAGKSTLAEQIGGELGASVRNTPPPSMEHLRPRFIDCPEDLKRVYYAVGNYVAASELMLITRDSPVIMDRFWHSTGAYAMANFAIQNSTEIPPPGDAVYSWPSDLLKPDLVIFLQVTEATRVSRMANREEITDEELQLKNCSDFREKLTSAFKNMADPKAVIVDGNPTIEEVKRSVLDLVRKVPNMKTD